MSSLIALLTFREPVSAWTHCSWLLLSVPATMLLWRRGDPARRVSLLVFGVSLAICYAGSTLFHAVRRAELDRVVRRARPYRHLHPDRRKLHSRGLESAPRPDQVGDPGDSLGRGHARHGHAAGLRRLLAVLVDALLSADGLGSGDLLHRARPGSHAPHSLPVTPGRHPLQSRRCDERGAVAAALAGVFGTHELFHIFVMAGSACHFLFMLEVAAYPDCRIGASCPLPPGASFA